MVSLLSRSRACASAARYGASALTLRLIATTAYLKGRFDGCLLVVFALWAARSTRAAAQQATHHDQDACATDKKAAAKGALAPRDNTEEAPRKRMADASGIVSKAKQKKAKKKPAARKKKRARDDEEPASPKRAREDPEDWDFDNGVDE